MKQAGSVPAALAAWRESERRLEEADHDDRERYALEVAQARIEYQRLVADQAASEADQAASDRDQAASDADRRQSDRDPVAV